ncbi:MAG: histidinol dehydrogenase [Rikenellaceae bacterium]
MIKIIDCRNSDATPYLERPFSKGSDVGRVVEEIVAKVKEGGDKALSELSRTIEKVDLGENFLVSEAEFTAATAKISAELKDAIEVAITNIERFHAAQKHHEVVVDSGDGVVCVQRSRAISRVGLYIPGGTAPLFSTVLMLALPSKIAGCKEVILCTPPAKDGSVAAEILYCAKACGVDKVYKIGGAAAIAAMAYGTETIKPCFKIFGPGNRYVTAAKQLVASSQCSIDMPAGPSEVMVVCDETANSRFVAADLLSQAEHGTDSQAIAVVLSKEMAQKVKTDTEAMVGELSRADFASLSLSNSSILIVKDKEQMLKVINEYAPEHLIISTKDAETFALEVDNAGSIFIGNYTPESAGDYCSGTNHTLPTSGWAKSMSGVNLDSFCKKITYQSISKEGIQRLAPSIIAMANAEGLTAHALAAEVRREQL